MLQRLRRAVGRNADDMSIYSRQFYEDARSGARSSAEAVLPRVFELWPADSVVDVGCGTGTWLAVAEELGANRILGIDSPHIDPGILDIPAGCFLAADLEQPLPTTERFDLVLSLEVAEHLRPESAPAHVDALTRLGPAVLFSAAVPLQGGIHHVNEQWPEYWAELFLDRNFHAVGNLRSEFWNNTRVEWWYRQNMFLFVREGHAHEMLGRAPQDSFVCLPLVHPGNYYDQHQRRGLLRRVARRIRGLVAGHHPKAAG